MIHNNCEHFVYECVFGIKYSEQEEEVRRKWRMFASSGAEGRFAPDRQDGSEKTGSE